LYEGSPNRNHTSYYALEGLYILKTVPVDFEKSYLSQR